MKYNEESIDKLKKKGVFEKGGINSEILKMSEEEKEKLRKEFEKAHDLEENKLKTKKQKDPKEEYKEIVLANVQLSFLERLFLLFLQIFNIDNEISYKTKKVIKNIKDDLKKINPPIFDLNYNKVTKYFGYKIFELYKRSIILKKIIDKTINSDIWNNINYPKTGIEIFFESYIQINKEEIEKKFSKESIEKIFDDNKDFKYTEQLLEKSINIFLSSIKSTDIIEINKIYTGLINLKELIEFNYIDFCKLFNSEFDGHNPDNFFDVPGNYILMYLKMIEQKLIQIDLSIDYTNIFKILESIINQYNLLIDKEKEKIENYDIDIQVSYYLELLKEFIVKKYITHIIQIIENDPFYLPDFKLTKHDFFILYKNTFEGRVKFILNNVLEEKTNLLINSLVSSIFSEVKFIGFYNQQNSETLKELGYHNFIYCNHINYINTFIYTIYKESILPSMNLILLKGIFNEKQFQYKISDCIYQFEQFELNLQEFSKEVSMNTYFYEKLRKILNPNEKILIDNKKIIDNQITSINNKAYEIYQRFKILIELLFNTFSTIYNDAKTNPPKYIKNIHFLTEMKDFLLMPELEKGYNNLLKIIELFKLLK